MQSGIYEIVNLANGKRYIGSASSIKARWSVHRHMLARGNHHARHLQRAWDKYGPQSFEFRVLLICAKSELIGEEQRLIDEISPAYNSAPKAGRGGGMSEDGRARLSLRMKGNTNTLGMKHSPESLARLSEAKRGNTAMKGKKRNPIAVAKTAAAHRGMKRSEETRQKIAAKKRGCKLPPRSAEHRAKISAAQRGRKISAEHMAALQAGRARRVFTDEQRKRVSEALKLAYAEGRKSRARPPEYRAKISAGLRGRKATAEHRANQSAAQRGMKRKPKKE